MYAGWSLFLQFLFTLVFSCEVDQLDQDCPVLSCSRLYSNIGQFESSISGVEYKIKVMYNLCVLEVADAREKSASLAKSVGNEKCTLK